ncbi:MAG: hypothetical protein JNK10_13750 [Cyclobacteriaceae bacterium]|nr:hypothetical protein [Cyclobacteriaceae bacterium]
MAILVFTLIIFGLFFALMSVRLFLVKNGEFRGTCATQSPFLAKEGIVCGYCGKVVGEGEACPNVDKEDESIAPFPTINHKPV